MPPRSSPQKYQYGQYFSRTDVVDLILGFCVKQPDASLLDPSCGEGVFLLRAFERLKFINPQQKPPHFLRQLWGVDLEISFATETQRQLNKVTGNPPPNNAPGDSSSQILAADFFDCQISRESPPRRSSEHNSGFLTNGEPLLPTMGAIMGNPPYTRQEVLGGHTFGKDYKEKLARILKQEFNLSISARAGIYAYFICHSTLFLEAYSKGRMGFVTLRSWLDVDFGQVLKQFILDHYRIIAIIQSLQEKWFSDAQMIPCILILEREGDQTARAGHVAKFVQLKEDLSSVISGAFNSGGQNPPATDWTKVDQFVTYIENLPEIPLTKDETRETLQEMFIHESPLLRVIGVSQKHLDPARKWGVFLGAPTIYFKIFENPSSRQLLVPLQSVLSKITPGIKSGANNFFYFPNAHFITSQWTDSHLVVDGKGSHKGSKFAIERKFLSPILIKFKPQQRIFIHKNDGYCLTTTQPRAELEASRANILEYLQFGEKYPPDQPYALRSTCQNRISTSTGREWFHIASAPVAPLLHFEITTNREVTFYLPPDLHDPILQKHMLVNYGFYQLFPAKEEDTEVILALLNSTFGYLVLEFGGRYLENRDGTISNETRIGDLEVLPIINPTMIPQDLRKKMIGFLHQLGNRPVRRIWEEFEQPDRLALDSIIFSEILGVPANQVQEIYSSLSEIVKNRNKKKD